MLTEDGLTTSGPAKTEPAHPVTTLLSGRTRYNRNVRDHFYGMELDPYTGKIDGCKDRD